jgi:hypothetical protein
MTGLGQRNSAVDEIDRKELDKFQGMAAGGVAVAVPAAVHYCLENEVPVPQWLLKASLDLLCDLLRREKSTKRGRAAGAAARYRQDMIDFMRWNEVFVLREKQQMHQQSLIDHSDMVGSDRYAEEAARAQWLGRSLSRIFECVSEVLERTEAFGSPVSIERSYREVERNMRSTSGALRYAIFHPLFVRMLGIEPDLKYGRNVKIAPWRHRPPSRKRAAPKRSASQGPSIAGAGT